MITSNLTVKACAKTPMASCFGAASFNSDNPPAARHQLDLATNTPQPGAIAPTRTPALSWIRLPPGSALPGAVTYKVKRSAVGGGPDTVFASSISTLSHTDPFAPNNSDDVVSAVNANGESADSAQAKLRVF